MDRLTCVERLLLDFDRFTEELLFLGAERVTVFPEERLTVVEDLLLTPEEPDRLVIVPLVVDLLDVLERTTLDELELELV